MWDLQSSVIWFVTNLEICLVICFSIKPWQIEIYKENDWIHSNKVYKTFQVITTLYLRVSKLFQLPTICEIILKSKCLLFWLLSTHFYNWLCVLSSNNFWIPFNWSGLSWPLMQPWKLRWRAKLMVKIA